MSAAIYRASFRPRFYEVGADGKVRHDVVLDWLQEAAGTQAFDFGMEMAKVMARGVTWAISRQRALFHGRPGLGEEIWVETWPAKLVPQAALRGYRVSDGDGRLLVSAIAAWVVLDLKTFKPIDDLPGFLTGIPFEPGDLLSFERRVIPAVREGLTSTATAVGASHLDMNGHVNNARQAALVLDAAFASRGVGADLREIDILYRAQAGAGDVLEVVSEADGQATARHALRAHGGGLEIARAATAWVEQKS
ncbi:MAG: acyl-[acyl-carrier-protein] thioesterase [Geminicoccaceae bacterium]